MQTPLSDFPDWALLGIDQITSSRKAGRVGLLPISRSTWLKLVEKGLVPRGAMLVANKIGWPVSVVREAAEKLNSGAFTKIDLWKKTS